MSKIRVLIIAEELATRRLLAKALDGVGAYELHCQSETGAAALETLECEQPDVLILGVPAETTRSLELLEMLQRAAPRLPVLAASALARKGSPLTIDVLSRGARGYVTLPPANSSAAVELARDALQTQIQAIPGLGSASAGRAGRPERPSAARPSGDARSGETAGRGDRFEILAIGASTGGPNVLASMVEKLPVGFPIPIVIVQHMPASFTRSLAERLNNTCSLRVREAADGDVPCPGTAWVAPGDRHMVLRANGGRVQLALHDGPPENSCRPSVDILFRSVAEVYGGRSLAVVLTGMGRDGLNGCREIRASGGSVLVQDEATSVVWGMPGHVAQAGLADEVLPLEQLAAEILRRVGRGSRTETDHGCEHGG